MMSTIARFFMGEIPDAFGRSFDTFLTYSHFWLEHDHKYIQCLFPIDEGTKFNRHAPLVTLEDRAAFSASSALRARHMQALDVMLSFWGLERNGNNVTIPVPFSPSDHVWLKPSNHNQLRLTRVIRSLALLGNADVAAGLARCVIDAAQQCDGVSQKTIGYWQGALERN